jgi:hypothetical protein
MFIEFLLCAFCPKIHWGREEYKESRRSSVFAFGKFTSALGKDDFVIYFLPLKQ